MFQAQVDVIGVTATSEETIYIVSINGHPFSFRDGDKLRIGVQMIGGVMTPIEMPILDPKNPDLFVAFQMGGEQARRMIDEGLSARFMASPVPRPSLSVS